MKENAMKYQILKYLFIFPLLLIGNSKATSLDFGNIDAIITFDSITKITQNFNPDAGQEVIILGKVNGKVFTVYLNITTANTGAQASLEACQRDAFLAFHYPEKYNFVFYSNATIADNKQVANFSVAGGHNIGCTLQGKGGLLNVPAIAAPIQATTPD